MEVDWVFFRVSMEDDPAAVAFYAVMWPEHTLFRDQLRAEGLCVTPLHVDEAALAVAHGAVGFVSLGVE